MGLDVSGVGNHEFDEGWRELRRMQFGGCHPEDGCQDGDPFSGAFFQYLAANVFFEGTDRTVLPPYEIERAGREKVAFIGLTLEGTPLVVTPSGVEGLEFRDEVVTTNALVRKLRRRGIETIVVLVHEGGQQTAPFAEGFMDVNRCDNFSGAIKPIVEALDREVDAVVVRPHAPAVRLHVQRHPDHQRGLVRPPDHQHRPDASTAAAATSSSSTRRTTSSRATCPRTRARRS